jgi:hypothetical protein
MKYRGLSGETLEKIFWQIEHPVTAQCFALADKLFYYIWEENREKAFPGQWPMNINTVVMWEDMTQTRLRAALQELFPVDRFFWSPFKNQYVPIQHVQEEFNSLTEFGIIENIEQAKHQELEELREENQERQALAKRQKQKHSSGRRRQQQSQVDENDDFVGGMGDDFNGGYENHAPNIPQQDENSEDEIEDASAPDNDEEIDGEEFEHPDGDEKPDWEAMDIDEPTYEEWLQMSKHGVKEKKEDDKKNKDKKPRGHPRTRARLPSMTESAIMAPPESLDGF